MAKIPRKFQQVTVEQQPISGTAPLRYSYKVVRLVNRTLPVIGSVLEDITVDALMADPAVNVMVE